MTASTRMPRRSEAAALAVGRRFIDDAQPTARPQNPHGLAQRLCPPASFPDVADRQLLTTTSNDADPIGR
jgi:hypothetical protein